MKIFTTAQIHALDKYTIEHEPINSIDLMERAAKAVSRAISDRWGTNTHIVVFAGPGNNGGDALAVARMLAEQNYKVDVFLFNVRNHLSDDCATNKKRFVNTKRATNFTEITVNFDPPALDADTLVIDGLFGSGLDKPLTGGFASLVKYINQSQAKVVSIDMPSGLMPEDNTYNVSTNIVKADLTLTLQQKKLAMMFADNAPYIGKLCVLDIRLSRQYIANTEAQYSVIEENEIRKIIRPRDDFAHKGLMGNALLVVGSYGMAGAAVLAARACLRSGVGKIIVHTPQKNNDIVQIAVPEAVMQTDNDETYFSEAVATNDFNALGIGPGLGQNENTAIALIAQLNRATCPVVADADALNILANHRAWLQQLPANMILTPHPKEFDRLSDTASGNDYERLVKAQEMSRCLRVYIILKGHYSALCAPDGNVTFNSTGNSGMATAGSGDVLTGIVTAMLARGYSPRDACLLAMYLHGLAGDIAVKEVGKESLTAGDIIRYLPQAFKRLED